MKKVYSARKRLFRYFLLVFTATLVLVLLFGVYSNWTYDRQLRYCADAALGIQVSRLTGEAERLTAFGQKLIGDSPEFRRLAGASVDGYTRASLLYGIRQMMESAVPGDGLLLICSRDGDILRYVYGADVLGPGQMMEKRHVDAAHALRGLSLRQEKNGIGPWSVAETEGFTFLYSVQRYQGMYVCAAMELNTFAGETEEASEDGLRLLFDRGGAFITGRDLAAERGLRPENIPGLQRFFRRDVFLHEDVPALGIGMNVLMPVGSVWQVSRLSMLMLLALAVLCGAVYVAAYRLIRRIVIYPLQQISSLSREMSDGEEGSASGKAEPESIEELNILRDSISQLADQKVSLRKKRDDEETRKEHALLQYYQLQTRSHFFLNCLKSLYSMLETRQIEQVQEMIISFSNHLRFIFHDNLSLVPLRAELDEVRDYHRIICMDSRQPLILTQEIAEDARECLVPPLIIQTFLENSYKYNGRGREVLEFSVRIDRMEFEGTPRLRIRLSDDGLGYPPEMLDDLNSAPEEDVFERYHIGTRNLKRRMDILYRGDYELAFFNGPEGGANVLISMPFRREEADPAPARTDEADGAGEKPEGLPGAEKGAEGR